MMTVSDIIEKVSEVRRLYHVLATRLDAQPNDDIVVSREDAYLLLGVLLHHNSDLLNMRVVSNTDMTVFSEGEDCCD